RRQCRGSEPADPPVTSIECAGTEPHEDIVAMRQIEIAIARMMHARPRHERAAADVAVGVKPRLRVIAVAIGRKSGIRRERVGHPPPHRAAPFDEAERRRTLPFRFGGKPTARPSAVGLGLERIDVAHRLVRGQWRPASEPEMLPAVAYLAPSPGMIDAL